MYSRSDTFSFVGFVLKKDKKKAEDEKEKITIEELVEKEVCGGTILLIYILIKVLRTLFSLLNVSLSCSLTLAPSVSCAYVCCHGISCRVGDGQMNTVLLPLKVLENCINAFSNINIFQINIEFLYNKISLYV